MGCLHPLSTVRADSFSLMIQFHPNLCLHVFHCVHNLFSIDFLEYVGSVESGCFKHILIYRSLYHRSFFLRSVDDKSRCLFCRAMESTLLGVLVIAQNAHLFWAIELTINIAYFDLPSGKQT